jgi:FAD-dependent oxidoreductase domain-containing protein 1
MSKTFDVVIIGGGCIGSSIAYFLVSEPGFKGSVCVVERDPTYQFCSTARATGGIRQQFSTEENISIGLFGAAFMRDIGQHLAVDGEKPDIGFKENGYLLLATDEALPIMRENHARQVSLGAQIAWLDHDALGKRFPWLNISDVVGAFFGERNEGWYDPYALLTAFRRKARSLGVTYVQDDAVGLTLSGDRVTEVKLKENGTLSAGAVVNAAGARDAAAVARWAGVELPVEPRKRSAFLAKGPQPFPSSPLRFEPNGVWSRPEGQGLLCGATPEEADDAPTTDFDPHWNLWEEVVWPTLAERSSVFEAMKVERAYAGHYDYNTLDQNAIIGLWPGFANFFIATGYSGHGVMQSPASGRAVTDLIVHGGYRALDLTRFGVERILAKKPLLETGIY